MQDYIYLKQKQLITPRRTIAIILGFTSQTAGAGRGLKWLCAALKYCLSLVTIEMGVT